MRRGSPPVLGDHHPVEVVVPARAHALGQLEVADLLREGQRGDAVGLGQVDLPGPHLGRGRRDAPTASPGASARRTRRSRPSPRVRPPPPRVMKKATDPLAGSPDQLPIQRLSRSGLGHRRPDVVDRCAERALEDDVRRPVALLAVAGGAGVVGCVVMLSPRLDGCVVGAGATLADRAADLEVEAVERGLVEPGAAARRVEPGQPVGDRREARPLEPVVPLAAAVVGRSTRPASPSSRRWRLIAGRLIGVVGGEVDHPRRARGRAGRAGRGGPGRRVRRRRPWPIGNRFVTYLSRVASAP